MFALVALVYGAIEAERAEREQSRATSEVIAELQRVERAALNGETGQRGYLVTLDRRYLQPYEAGRSQYEPAIRRLHELLDPVATPRQRQLLDQIDRLADMKFAEMERSVTLLEDGQLLEARRGVLTDEGQETMERLRRTLGELESIERAVLTEQIVETARIEARVLPLLGALLALLILTIAFGARLVARTARAEADAAQATALSEARDQADLLARELNHRVKNLFAVVLAIVQMSARDRPDAKDVTDAIARRIRALLTAHEVSQGELERETASLKTLIETSLAPYRSERHVAEVAGPEVMLPARIITPLGLVLHELTTNAVKYGAWAGDGTIHVDWSRKGDRMRLVWRETGAGQFAEPERRGFGSLMMTSAARQFGGSVDRQFKPEGIEIVIELPIPEPSAAPAAGPLGEGSPLATAISPP